MSKQFFQRGSTGRRFDGPENRDLEQKLTYQQLLNENHNYKIENKYLKESTNRLGRELQAFQTNFDTTIPEENTTIFNAIASRPVLHQYEKILTPLFNAYESKLGETQKNFQTLNDEFINLQKKFQEVAAQNERMKVQLMEKVIENIALYRHGTSDKLQADFGQIILQQINEKQKVLVEENSRLEKDLYRFKADGERAKKELADLRDNTQDSKSSLKECELSLRQTQTELKGLKETSMALRIENNELESEKRKLTKDLERAASQMSQLAREKDMYFGEYQKLKKEVEAGMKMPSQFENSRSRQDFASKSELPFQNDMNDHLHKKFPKLEKDLNATLLERNKLKEQLDTDRIRFDQLASSKAELQKRLDFVEKEKTQAQINESALNKFTEELKNRLAEEAQKSRRVAEDQRLKGEEKLSRELQRQQQKIHELEEEVAQLKMDRDRAEREGQINFQTAKDTQKPSKGNDRVSEKLKEKLSINEQLFKEQLEILQHDNVYLKREAQDCRNQLRTRNEELRKLKIEMERMRKEHAEISEQKVLLIEEIRRVRNDYEGNLKEKEKTFDQKIRQIKGVVEESEKKRKSEREKVQQTSREYKRMLQEIKNTYETRIRVLEREAEAGKVTRQFI